MRARILTCRSDERPPPAADRLRPLPSGAAAAAAGAAGLFSKRHLTRILGRATMLYSALIIWAAARNGSVITAFVGMVLRRSDRLVTCRSSLGESVGRSFVGWAFVVRSFIGQAFVGLSLVRRSRSVARRWVARRAAAAGKGLSSEDQW